MHIAGVCSGVDFKRRWPREPYCKHQPSSEPEPAHSLASKAIHSGGSRHNMLVRRRQSILRTEPNPEHDRKGWRVGAGHSNHAICQACGLDQRCNEGHIQRAIAVR
jgi:hypothetical protein